MAVFTSWGIEALDPEGKTLWKTPGVFCQNWGMNPELELLRTNAKPGPSSTSLPWAQGSACLEMERWRKGAEGKGSTAPVRRQKPHFCSPYTAAGTEEVPLLRVGPADAATVPAVIIRVSTCSNN